MIAELAFSPTAPVFSRRAERSIGVRTLIGITSPTVISGEEEDLEEEDLDEEEEGEEEDLEALKAGREEWAPFPLEEEEGKGEAKKERIF